MQKITLGFCLDMNFSKKSRFSIWHKRFKINWIEFDQNNKHFSAFT